MTVSCRHHLRHHRFDSVSEVVFTCKRASYKIKNNSHRNREFRLKMIGYEDLNRLSTKK